ncbi:MAG: hypothetical protein GY768_24920 [Planctomycetaceae bacterium]|nr:hypothetical protein [Planctomycetaceae bacterium]
MFSHLVFEVFEKWPEVEISNRHLAAIFVFVVTKQIKSIGELAHQAGEMFSLVSCKVLYVPKKYSATLETDSVGQEIGSVDGQTGKA